MASESLILRNKEDHFLLEELGKMLPQKRVYRTILRWVTEGTERPDGSIVLMEKVETPSGLMSSLEAYFRFLEALNDQ